MLDKNNLRRFEKSDKDKYSFEFPKIKKKTLTFTERLWNFPQNDDFAHILNIINDRVFKCTFIWNVSEIKEILSFFVSFKKGEILK